MSGQTLPLPRLPDRSVSSSRELGLATQLTAVERANPEFSQYYRVVKRHRQLIAIVFCVSVIAAIVVTRVLPRQYTATSTILIEPREAQALSLKDLSADSQGASDDDYYYETQYQILKSRTLAHQVILDLGLDHAGMINKWAPKPGLLDRLRKTFGSQAVPSGSESTDERSLAESRLIDSYLDEVGVKPEQRSRLVAVSFTSYDPRLSSTIVNAHVRAYITRAFEIHADTSRDAEEFLSKKLAELKGRLKTSEVALNQFRSVHTDADLDPDGSGKVLMTRFTEISDELTRVQDDEIRLRAENDIMRSTSHSSLPTVIGDPVVQQLTEEVAAQSAQYAAMSNRFSPEYHPLADLAVKLRETKSRLNQATMAVVESARADYNIDNARQANLLRERNAVRAKIIALNDASLQDAVLQREVDINNRLYKSVLARLNEIEVAAEVPVTNISIVDTAEPPQRPSSPKTLLVVGVTAFLALFGGLGLSFLRDHLDDTFKDPEDLQRYTGLQRLGLVPNFKQLREDAYTYGKKHKDRAVSETSNQQRELLVTADGYSIAGEIYRGLRTALLFASPQHPPRTILITSAGVGEGKTVTTINIGLAFAQMGARTLLVDADLRSPRCHEVLGFSNDVGLNELLVSQAEPTRAIRPSRAAGLYVLTAGSRPGNPGALLGSNKMRELLATFGQQFDHVLIDSSPALEANDAIMLSTMVDGVLLVAGPLVAKTSFRDMCARLLHVRARILGVVMNEVEIPLATAHGA